MISNGAKNFYALHEKKNDFSERFKILLDYTDLKIILLE